MGIFEELYMAVQVNNYFGSYYPNYQFSPFMMNSCMMPPIQSSPFMNTWVMPPMGMNNGFQQMQGLMTAYMHGSYLGMMLNMQIAAAASQQMTLMQQMQALQPSTVQPQTKPQENDGDSEVSGKNKNKEKTEKTDKSEGKGKTTPKTQTVTTEMKNQIINGTYTGDNVKVNGITHYRYADCKTSDRVSVGNGKQLHKDAAEAFNKMKAAAAKEGISLNVHSGLRTAATQKDLFSNKMKTKNRSFEDNLKWSAPAGFSEHHTGLALDINCAESSFANSKEYKWLKEHASEFGFELSFPENNAQGVGFEPWHWRYVGTNGEYKSVFAAARDNDPRFKS